MSQREMDNNALNIIVKCFKKQYGFAPAKSHIHFLEGADNGCRWLSIGFHVGGVGYFIDLRNISYDNVRVERCSIYDM